jgi:hypothetical protein
MIHDAGGIAVAVHPYHSSGIRDAVYDAPFDAVELESGSIFCSDIVQRNISLGSDSRLADASSLGSSDSHYVNAVGSCYTVVEMNQPTLEAAREAILKRRTRAVASQSYLAVKSLLGTVGKLK